VLHPQVLKHREGLLPLLQDRNKRNHALGHRGLQLEGSGPRVGNVRNHEAGQAGEQPNRFREVLRFRFIEGEHHRHPIPITQLLSEPFKNGDPAAREAPQYENPLLPDCVDDVADRLVREEQVDELGDLQVVDGDLGFAVRDDQVLLPRPLQLQVPRRDPVDAAAREGGARKIRADGVRPDEARSGEVRPGEVRLEEGRLVEVRPDQVRPGEIRPHEVRQVKVRL
jgi:hypothetical protein